MPKTTLKEKMRNNCILKSEECFDGSCPRHHQGSSAGGRDGNTTTNYSSSTKTTLRERKDYIRSKSDNNK